jgi:diadenosine tetraphosphate (Ap4A) HIT family hydrolase
MCSGLGRRDGSFIVEWPHHVWRLAEDQTWPGWSMLILKKHATELFELTSEERAAAMEEVARAAKVLKEVTSAKKMNLELLGNQEPHVHWHIVPRHEGDPGWNRPIWAHAHPPKKLSPKEHDGMVTRLRRAIAAST